MALAVSAGVCNAGRIGTVVTTLGLTPSTVPVCAWASIPAVTIINVAVSIDLMTSPGVIDVPAIKHICLVGNSAAMVQESTRAAVAAAMRWKTCGSIGT